LIEFGMLALEKKIFFKFSVYFYFFCYNLPLERGNPLHLKKRKLESPSLKDYLCQVWLKLVRGFWKISKELNVYRQTDGRTDGRRTMGDQNNSLELSA
jgi:hypothetical protein